MTPTEAMTRVEIGQQFGRLTVTGPEIRVFSRSGQSRRGVACRCECGNEARVALARLIAGDTRSCGCLAREQSARNSRSPARLAAATAALRTHGLRRHPLYDTWKSMMHRCLVESDPKFRNYGGRGITVCAEWHDVRNFVAWIDANLGPRPKGMTLDRIDNESGNYEPGNVRWATGSEQNLNQRRSRTAKVRELVLAASNGHRPEDGKENADL